MKNEDLDHFFENVWEELRHWPYTIHQIDDTLDSRLIEGRGKQILFQSLNAGLLTAFVGSGVSAAYGRMSWTEWKEAQLRVVSEGCEKFNKLANDSVERLKSLDRMMAEAEDPSHGLSTEAKADWRISRRWLQHRRQITEQARWEIKNLERTFKASASDKGSFPGGEDLPIQFEIAKKLHELLLRHSELFSPIEGEDEQKEQRVYFGTRCEAREGAPIDALQRVFKRNRALREELGMDEGWDDIKDIFEDFERFAGRPEVQMPFDKLAKHFLVDECPHADNLFQNAFSSGTGAGRILSDDDSATVKSWRDSSSLSDPGNLKRDLDGIRDDATRYKILAPFRIDPTIKYLHRLKDSVPQTWKPVIEFLTEELEEYSTEQSPLLSKRVFLTPTSRFLFTMLCQLDADPVYYWKHTTRLGPKGIGKALAPKSTQFKSRRSIMADRFDPLAKTIGNLRITNYLTTNYDFEIERQFIDRGYRRFDDFGATPATDAETQDHSQRSFRVNGLGGSLSDLSFSTDTATDILSFAAGAGTAEASVFHLHGRATETDPIVATERDYMDQYLRDVPNRDVIDESILMAFAANPILFLGLGMEEADVLRPLRQFISDQDRYVGYRAIVLLPASKDFESRAKTSAGLYMRYGAHTVFYGGGEIQLTGFKDPQPIDWLHRMSALIGALEDAVKKRAKTIEKKLSEDLPDKPTEDDKIEALDKPLAELPNFTPEPIATFAKVNEAVGKLGSDLKTRENSDKEYPALAMLLDMPRARLETLCDEKTDATKIQAALAGLNLRNCDFTTRRHGSGDMVGDDRQIRIDGAGFTHFYVSALSRILRIALAQPEGETVGEMCRSLTAMQTALSGIRSALMTATFNAALDGLHKEWRHWWKDWQQSPPVREPTFEVIPPPTKKFEEGFKDQALDEDPARDEIIFPRRFIRHRLINVITDIKYALLRTAPALRPDHSELVAVADGASDKAEQTAHLTGVRVFDTFIYDVSATTIERSRSRAMGRLGRLMHTLAAGRGQGKGVVFSVFSTRLGITSYIRAAHPKSGIGDLKNEVQPFFVGAIFVNLGFAVEIASVYDMTRGTLVDLVARLRALVSNRMVRPSNKRIAKLAIELFLGSRLEDSLKDADREEVKNHASTLEESFSDEHEELETEVSGLSRTDAIRYLMEQYNRGADEYAACSPMGLKLRPRFFMCIHTAELLFDSRRRPKNMEIADFLETFMGESAKDVPFDLVIIGDLNCISRSKMPRLITSVRDNNGIPQDYRARVKDLAQAQGVETQNQLSVHAQNFNFVHFARALDPITFLVDNFLPLAIALFLNRRKKDPSTTVISEDLEASGRKALAKCLTQRVNKWRAEKIPQVNSDYRDTHFAMIMDIINELVKSDVETGQKDEDGDPVLWPRSGTDMVKRQSVVQHLIADYESMKDQPASSGMDDASEWEDAADVFGGNRFSLTILMAAAQHVALAEKNLSDGGAKADILLKNVVSRVRNVSVSGRETEVLKAVMSVYENTSIIGDPDHDHELHLHLLRNIAVIGCPVSPNVLVRLPDIRDYFKRVEMQGNDQDTRPLRISRRRMVASALATLSERGLVFRISPHPKLVRLEDKVEGYGDLGKLSEEKLLEKIPSKGDDAPLRDYVRPFKKWAPSLEYRYGLHRQVQSYCFQRLGHLTAQPVSANSFAPSLYASMPSRVVRLSKEGYLFLRRLLLGLSQYPDIRQEDSARDIPIFRDDDIVTRVQALRAGMSLARNSFSISAVSRFSDDSTGLSFTRKRGYFETYRVRLRWLLRKAWEIHEPRTLKDPKYLRVNALYRDEVVWLYNEVAVTCLAQGSLVEAIGHARQAISLNSEIEGKIDGGRLFNMLSLNLAIIQIERGRLAGAQRRLREICDSEDYGRHRVYWLAKAYLALIAQLQGRQKEAEDGFNQAIKHLRAENEDRALALVHLHLGRLLARRDVEKAKRTLAQARDYAESGGHEDVRHRVMVSEVWISQTFEEGKLERQQQDRVKLREIEHYARMMGMYSLLVEALHAQGRILLDSGDNSSSGKLMTRAMAIARRHDQTLRLNAIMIDYAKVLMARRRFASAKRLLNSVLVMAKRSGYSTAVVRIHTALQEAEAATQVG